MRPQRRAWVFLARACDIPAEQFKDISDIIGRELAGGAVSARLFESFVLYPAVKSGGLGGSVSGQV